MRLHKTGHEIADTISDLIGELPDGDYKIAYGILRHDLFRGNTGSWFEIDKAMWGASHFDGGYRISFQGTQPKWHEGPSEPHGLELEPWKENTDDKITLICPPSQHVCEFFGVDEHDWTQKSIYQRSNKNQLRVEVRRKTASNPINWEQVGEVITFNSSVGVEALRRGIPVISDPDHSTIGSYTKAINKIDNYDRGVILDFISAHQFKLVDKGKLECLIRHYVS